MPKRLTWLLLHGPHQGLDDLIDLSEERLNRSDVAKAVAGTMLSLDHESSKRLADLQWSFQSDIQLAYSASENVTDGKKINWKDGFRAIYCIINYGIMRQ